MDWFLDLGLAFCFLNSYLSRDDDAIIIIIYVMLINARAFADCSAFSNILTSQHLHTYIYSNL